MSFTVSGSAADSQAFDFPMLAKLFDQISDFEGDDFPPPPRYDTPMDNLTANQARVLGVLIEKELTTPNQYPLTLNALVNGCNQLNNRDPVLTLDEADVVAALEGLREKGGVIFSDALGSRVMKYKHTLTETLDSRPVELSLLCELLLRGPQTLGELRGRSSRMYPFESMEIVQNVLEGLMARTPPLIGRLPPLPGSRAGRFTQTLAPGIHPAETAGTGETVSTPASAAVSAGASASASLESRLATLESELAALRAALIKLSSSLGEGDPFA